MKKLMFARLVEMEEGSIKILGQPWVMAPGPVMVELIHGVKPDEKKRLFGILYDAGKKAGLEYMIAMKEKIPNDLEELTKVGVNSLNLGGWGKVIVSDFDWKNKRGIVHFEDSVLAALWKKKYGMTKEPLDYIMCGFISGGLSIITGADINGTEKVCAASGASACQFILIPSEGKAAPKAKTKKAK